MADGQWFRGAAGERGKIGDHGQDGQPGIQGIQGIQGEPGTPDSVREVDREVREALAVALGEKQSKRDEEVDEKLSRVDTRLLVIFAIFIGALLVFSLNQSREFAQFRKEIVSVCQGDNEGKKRQNETLDRLARNALTNPARTTEERKQIAADYEGLRSPISKCPPS